MKTLLPISIFALVFAACQVPTENTEHASEPATAPMAQHIAGEKCFLSQKGKDTVRLSYTSNRQGEIDGKLSYHLFEKDKNDGVIKGEMHGDTLFATYVFTAEGVTSTRDVAFLRKDNKLLEGYGDAQEENGTMHFRDKAYLKFGHGIILEATSCK